jgi:hypothetical protein
MLLAMSTLLSESDEMIKNQQIQMPSALAEVR